MDVSRISTETYLAQHAAAALPGAGVPWIAALRRHARERFATLGLPTLRTEAWRFTNFGRALRAEFKPAPAIAAPSRERLAEAWSDGGTATRLVFANGRFLPGLSGIGELPKGLTVAPLGQAISLQSQSLEARLGRIAAPDDDALIALNTILMQDGIVLGVAAGAEITRPVHLIHYSAGENIATHARNVVALAPGSRLALVQSHIGDGSYWTNEVTEIDLGEGARLDHVRLQDEGPDARHVGRACVRLARGARYESFVFSAGAEVSRNEIVATLMGERAECRLNGVALARGRQHVDNTTIVEHTSPHGRTQEIYKSIADDEARAVFQGRIVVRPQAQKTDAHELCRTLLLSPRAQASQKPELQIFADDVKCSHGATIGDLDVAALFYLRSRGIDELRARAILVAAFAAEVIEMVPLPALRPVLEQRLDAWLNGSTNLRRAA